MAQGSRVETRSQSIEFRLTPTELRRIHRAARAAKTRSVSAWLRALVLAESADGNGRPHGTIIVSLTPAQRALVTAASRWEGEVRASAWCREVVVARAREILSAARQAVLSTKPGSKDHEPASG